MKKKKELVTENDYPGKMSTEEVVVFSKKFHYTYTSIRGGRSCTLLSSTTAMTRYLFVSINIWILKRVIFTKVGNRSSLTQRAKDSFVFSFRFPGIEYNA